MCTKAIAIAFISTAGMGLDGIVAVLRFRRGFGWGGVYGWNDWSYGPYERRYGRRHYGERIGVDSGTRRMGGSIDTRMGGSIDTRTTTRSSTGVC